MLTELEWLSEEDPVALLTFGRRDAPDYGRKQRLLGVACCRQFDELITDGRSRAALLAIEELADGARRDSTRDEVLRASWRVPEDNWIRQLHGIRGSKADRAAEQVGEAVAALAGSTDSFAAHSAAFYAALTRARELTSDRPRSSPAAVVREVYANPYRPVAVAPAWLAWQGGTMLQLAQAIYEERAWERMPILADALEEAGCRNEDVLRHCRGQERCPKCVGQGWMPETVDEPVGIFPLQEKDWRESFTWQACCSNCHGGGWLPLHAPHVRGCFVVDALLGKE